MSEEEKVTDNERLFAEVMGVANVVRRAVLHGTQRMTDAIHSVDDDYEGVDEILEFALLFSQGRSIEEIADAMQLSETTIKVISDNSTLRW